MEECSVLTIAGLLTISRRTLGRRLAREGTTFQKLVNALRFEIACEMLVRDDAKFGTIAAALGYSELSGFTRAFRHWSGRTPTAWRAEHVR